MNPQNQGGQPPPNNRNPHNNQGGFSQKGTTIAISPIPDNMEYFINEIQERIAEENDGNKLDILKTEYSESRDYFTLTVQIQIQATALLKLNGYTFQGHSYFMATSAGKINIQLEDIISDRVDRSINSFLDLSELNRNNEYLDLKWSVPFILFYSGTLCRNTQKKIMFISYASNDVSNTSGFDGIHIYFPLLKQISFYNNPTTEHPSEQNIFGQYGIEKTMIPMSGFDYLNTPIIEFDNSVDYPQSQPLPPEPAIFDPKSIKTINDFREPIRIDQYRFPTNSFIDDFLERSRTDLPSLKNYYTTDAIFSITVETCPPNSPLAVYASSSNNRMKPNNPFACGNQQIADSHENLFGLGFDARVHLMSYAPIASNYFAVMLHGVFADSNECILGFDRSLVICQFDQNSYFITNDHLYIRRTSE